MIDENRLLMTMMNSCPRCAVLLMLFVSVTASATDDVADLDHLVDASAERRPLQTLVPEYPDKARRERLEGEVEVCFNVDRAGHTSRIAVRNSTHRIFEKPARRAIRASTYFPLAEGDKLIGIKTCRTFRFRLTPVAIEQPQ